MSLIDAQFMCCCSTFCQVLTSKKSQESHSATILSEKRESLLVKIKAKTKDEHLYL